MSGASEHAARWLFRGILVTLPWIGMGAVRCLTGVDTGAGFQPAYILLPPALVAALIAASADRAVRPAPAFRGRWWPWALSVAVILISWFGLSIAAGAATPAEARLRFLKQLIQYLLMLGYVALPVIMLDRDERWRDVPRWLAAGMLLQLAYGVGQAVHFGHPMEWFAALEGLFTSNPSILAGSEELFLGDAFAGVPRIRGTACEPLYLGNYLLAVAPWLVLAARRDRRWWAAAIAAAVLLLATWSRGAWLAAAAAAVTALFLARRAGGIRLRIPRTRTAAWTAVALAAVVAAMLVIIGPERLAMPWERLLQSFNRKDWSNLTRFYSMQAAWRAFLISPLVGVGWGQFGFHFPLLVDPVGLQSQFAWPVVNNYPLQILCETGAAGFSAFAAGCAAVARSTLRAASPDPAAERGAGPEARFAVVAAAAAVVGVWIQLLTFSQYNLPHIWLALGLLVAAIRRSEASAASAVPDPGKERP